MPPVGSENSICSSINRFIGFLVDVFSNEISAENDTRYQVLQDGTLMIENASDSDMGSYECMAKSPAGEVKSRLVKMKPSPQIKGKKDSGHALLPSMQMSRHLQHEFEYAKQKSNNKMRCK